MNTTSAFLSPVSTYSSQTMANIRKGMKPKKRRYPTSYATYLAQKEADEQVTFNVNGVIYSTATFPYVQSNEIHGAASCYDHNMQFTRPSAEILVTISSLGTSSNYFAGYNANTFDSHPATPLIINLLKAGNAVSFQCYEHHVKLPPLNYKDVKASRIQQIRYMFETLNYKALTNEAYQKHVVSYWGTKENFLHYLRTYAYLDDMQQANAYYNAKATIKEALLDLMQLEEERLFDEHTAHILSALDEVVFDDDMEYPHQDTTAPIIVAPDCHMKFGMELSGTERIYSAPYVVTTSNKFTPPNITKVIQAKLDSYYHSVDEFRIIDRETQEQALNALLTEYEDLKSKAEISFNNRYFRIKRNMRKAYDAAVQATPELIDDLYDIYEEAMTELRNKLSYIFSNPSNQRLVTLAEEIYQLQLSVTTVSHGNIDQKQSVEDEYDVVASYYLD